MKSVQSTMDRLEERCLRTIYELAGGKAIQAISFASIRRALGRSRGEVEQACDFWVRRGMLEWADRGRHGQVALTPVGLRRADHFAMIAWRPRSMR